MNTLTPRKTHAQKLAMIAEVTGGYNRRFTYKEAETFMATMQDYMNDGYPMRDAAQRAYDHYFIDRGVQFKRSLERTV